MSDYSDLAAEIMKPDPEAKEQADLAALRSAIAKIKENCYDYLVSLDRASGLELKHSGHEGKSNAEAMRWAFQRSQKEIKKLIDAHVRKYPD